MPIVMTVIGISAFVVNIALFLQPAAMISVWPWVLTPLTARVVGHVRTRSDCAGHRLRTALECGPSDLAGTYFYDGHGADGRAAQLG